MKATSNMPPRPTARQTAQRPLGRLYITLRYADLEPAELILGVLALLLAAVGVNLWFQRGFPPAVTPYQHITYSPLFWLYALVVGLVKVVAVIGNFRRLRLGAAILLAMMWGMLTLTLAAMSLSSFGWLLYGWFLMSQIYIIARRALDYGEHPR